MEIGQQFRRTGTDKNDFYADSPSKIVYTETITVIGVGKKRINFERRNEWIGRDGTAKVLIGGGYGNKGSWFQVDHIENGMPPESIGTVLGDWSEVTN